jgi:hypothetical protein
VRVIERLAQRPDLALVAVASVEQNLGFVLSGVRRRLLEIEAQSATHQPRSGG